MTSRPSPLGATQTEDKPGFSLPQIGSEGNRGLRTSSFSLGMAALGHFVFPPLAYASIPALIYMGVPSAQTAYAVLRHERRGSVALAETAALGVCLASGAYLAGSLGFCLYYLGRSVLPARPPARETARSLPITAHLCQDGVQLDVVAASLRQGDLVMVPTSEIIPADGLIVEGVAWIKSPLCAGDGVELRKGPGDSVCTGDLVMIGSVRLRVRRAE
ncbi:MAG: hypothetical protein KBG20_00255 [Caldilineaceae bacterium]|nr:hypothetical protein [Caldilineaceae bacterium]MBP8107218.1 hypothetical protein [Caldilineaceae bacterium]MBP8121384.1 hypothetical protein [Caldilineaceae bacterium]MBP9070689.1 hypothetical protein [Caldilineaceae bacterium]